MQSLKQKLKQWLPAVATAAVLGAPLYAQQPATPVQGVSVEKSEAVPDAPAAKIQMAILLDSSGSMSGLIDQARTQIWSAVNEFALARHQGKPVMLEVALYEYGSGKHPAEDGYLKQLVPLTDDLDRVSEALFAMKTGGSVELCGTVIDRAVRDLKWSNERADMKCIFIAGNEPFTQGSINYEDACKSAITKGIVVNTIHCGDHAKGVSGKWQQAAMLSDGSYMSINHNQQIVAIETPQDKQLVALNQELNKTYIAYGSDKKRAGYAARQEKQDDNAAAANTEVLASRVRFKANAQYCNDAWDLIDACKNGKVKLEDMKPEDLPESLRKMTVEERKAHLEKVASRRTELQKQIKEVNAKRDAFLAEARKKEAESGEKTLDEALIGAVRKQAKKKSYTFSEDK